MKSKKKKSPPRKRAIDAAPATPTENPSDGMLIPVSAGEYRGLLQKVAELEQMRGYGLSRIVQDFEAKIAALEGENQGLKIKVSQFERGMGDILGVLNFMRQYSFGIPPSPDEPLYGRPVPQHPAITAARQSEERAIRDVATDHNLAAGMMPLCGFAQEADLEAGSVVIPVQTPPWIGQPPSNMPWLQWARGDCPPGCVVPGVRPVEVNL